MADLATLDKVLHCLRVKLHVASQPSNSKVFMWSSVWSVATHQPMSMDDEEEMEEEAEETEAGLEDHEDEEDMELCDFHNRSLEAKRGKPGNPTNSPQNRGGCYRSRVWS